MASSNLPEAGARVTLDLSEFESGYKTVISDSAHMDKVMNDLGGSADLKVNVDDFELQAAARLVEDLNKDASPKVNVDDKDIKETSDVLESIKNMQAIQVAIDIAGTAKGFFESLGRFSGVGGVLELDNALASIEGRTGRMIPNAEKLISDLYTNGWGESREAIANTIVEATNLKIAQDDLAEATLTAFQVQSVSGGDTNEILRTMDAMVKNNLAPDFQTAGDILVTGFQNGDDRGQDLLDTFNEYGSTFGQLRISGEGALGLINSGLTAGVDNSDRIADSIRETGIRLATIGTDPNVANAFKQLDDMSDIDLASMLDSYEAGLISGDEFFGAFFEALADANTADPTKAKNIAAALVGTISEDFGVEALSQLTPVWDKSMGDLEGRAETAGNTISDTLQTSIDTFLRTIEQESVDLLSSDAIDLPGKIDAIKKGLQEALGVLGSGGTLGEAIEVAVDMPGLSDTIDTGLVNIQRVFGQFVLTLLEIVATIQDPLGINDNDKGTRAEIARLATQQLPFDIKVANPDELDTIINQALNRGVTDIGGSLNTALEELVAEGDFDKVRAIIGQIIADPETTPEAAQTLATKYEALIAEAQAKMKPPAMVGAPEGRGVAYNPFQNLGNLLPAGTQLGGALGGFASGFQTAVESLDTATTTATANIGTNLDNLNINLTDNTAAVVSNLDTTAAKVEELDQRTATALTQNTVTASFDAVAASAATQFPVVMSWMDRTAKAAAVFDNLVSIHLRSVIKQLNDLNFLAMVTIGNVTQAQALGGGGGGTVNNTTNNVTVNNNVQGNAQAAANGYAIGASLRPGGG